MRQCLISYFPIIMSCRNIKILAKIYNLLQGHGDPESMERARKYGNRKQKGSDKTS